MEERFRQDRLGFLLEKIREGHTAPEIDELDRTRIEKIRKRADIRAHKVGGEREEYATQLFNSLPLVSRATSLEQYSEDDEQGKDIRIRLNPDSLKAFLNREPSIQRVWVQVKSSANGVRRFRKRFGQSEEEKKDNLAAKKIIVVNTAKSEFEIIRDFEEQLRYVDAYWRQR